MEQLGFSNTPRRLYACSPSRLNAWLDCPRRYRMIYLDRPRPPKGPPWAHTSLGVSVHNALSAWWRLPRPRRTPQAAASLLDRGWIDEGYRDDAQSAQWRARARDMVVAYVRGLDPDVEPVGVERVVGLRGGRVAVSGRVDRLDLRDDGDGEELVVVDYKTGRATPTTEEARGSLALALYARAAQATLRRPCRRVELHHVPSGVIVTWEHTEESLARHLRRAEDIASECATADARHYAGEADRAALFPPRPGPQCGWCDYVRACPEGMAAEPPRVPWAALAAR